MTKPVRFPRKMEVWVPDSIGAAFDRLAEDQLLSVSDHARQAFVGYLRALNVPISLRRPASNQQPAE
jgi:hypothetical protein